MKEINIKTSENKTLFSVKEISDLGLIGYKSRKIRDFIKNGRLKAVKIMNGKRELVKVPIESIEKFREENFKEY